MAGMKMAIITRKGARSHLRAGTIYVVCMIGVVVTALLMTTMRLSPL